METAQWIKDITDNIQFKVKAQKYKRYKLITHVTLGERKGEGIVSVTRSLWDADSDCVSSWTYLSVRYAILMKLEVH